MTVTIVDIVGEMIDSVLTLGVGVDVVVTCVPVVGEEVVTDSDAGVDSDIVVCDFGVDDDVVIDAFGDEDDVVNGRGVVAGAEVVIGGDGVTTTEVGSFSLWDIAAEGVVVVVPVLIVVELVPTVVGSGVAVVAPGLTVVVLACIATE